MDASAITVNAPPDVVADAWREADLLAGEGAVRFAPAPGGRGTEVHAEAPDEHVSDVLRRFKQVVETGEIARSDAAPDGVSTKNMAHQEDAQP